VGEGEQDASREALRSGSPSGPGKLYLPPGYELEYGAGVLLMRRDEGSVVATFSGRGATPSKVAKTAEEDYRMHGKTSA
jgi:hypothetical protein